MSRVAGTSRRFTDPEESWIRANWTTQSLMVLAAHLHCRQDVLKREARLMGLPPRKPGRQPIKASSLKRAKQYNKGEAYNRGCERVADVDGERSSPPPAGMFYACPHCEFKSTDPLGHASHREAA
jgi:hypothetical protein